MLYRIVVQVNRIRNARPAVFDQPRSHDERTRWKTAWSDPRERPAAPTSRCGRKQPQPASCRSHTCCGSCAIRTSQSAGVTRWPRPRLPSAIRAFHRLSIRVRSRARRSFALPLFRQPSTSGRRNTCRVKRRRSDRGWRDRRTEVPDRVEASPGPATAPAACPVFEVFFGGARGGGKTDGMLGEWASHADLHGKNAVGLMVRRERVQLLETIERSREIYGPLGARYNDQDKMWRWP